MNYKNITKLSMLALTAGCMAFASCNKEDETIFINNATVDTVKAAQSAVKYQGVTNLVQVGAEGMFTEGKMSAIYLLAGQSKQIFSSEYKRIYSFTPEVVTVDNNGVVTAVAAGQAFIGYFFGNEAREVYVFVIDPESGYQEISGSYQPMRAYSNGQSHVSSALNGSKGLKYFFRLDADELELNITLFVPEGKSFQEAEIVDIYDYNSEVNLKGNLTVTPKSEGVYRIDLETSYRGLPIVFHFTYNMFGQY
ncbi:MAG: Ig-like domain-containing protein [Bacteroidales bacterium]|nr:Ig-like domain-containing protein [Bacteroidales bacterium]